MPRRGITPPKDHVKELLHSEIAVGIDRIKEKGNGIGNSITVTDSLSKEQLDKWQRQASFKAELERQILERKESKRREAERQRQVEIEEERRIELEREKLRRDFEAASRPHVIDSSPSLKQPVLQTRNQSLKTNDRLGETDHISVHGEKAKSTEEEGLVVYQLAEMQKLEESCSLSETRCIELLEQIKSLLTAATQLEADSRSPDGNKSKGQKEAPFIPIVYTVESLGPAVKEADIFTKHEATSNQNLVSIPSLEHKHKQRNTAELEISDKLSLWKRAGNQFRKLSVIKKPGGSENAWMVDGDEEDEEEKKEEKE